MVKDTQKFKEALLTEKGRLEEELGTVGRKNPDRLNDWEAVEGDVSVDTAEDAEVAEGIEQYENNSAVLNKLEARFDEVKTALEKIDSGNYGICEVCGKEIEEDRLLANPAAKTCKAHMQ
jgi:RNA polymerase-binding transcription factor DksA